MRSLRAFAILPLFAFVLLASSRGEAAKQPKSTNVFTAFGTTTCPRGFTALYTGTVIYLNISSSSSVNPVADGACWQTVPPDPPGGGGFGFEPNHFTPIGPCVVCRGR